MTWDPQQYGRYAAERSRPFFDLVDRIPVRTANFVVDLGCGTGALTKTLAERWPQAETLGVDSSPQMLTQALQTASGSTVRLRFVQADIAAWTPECPVDVLVSNAALHWLPDHEWLLPRLVGYLAPGGTLAVQMPDRFTSPSQVAIDEIAADPRWSDRLAGVGLHRKSVLPAERYIDLLRSCGCDVDAWRTTYYHLLRGENPVFEWLKGSGLGALLSELDDARREVFAAAVADRLRQIYPPTGDITIFPMQRLFFIATRRSG